MNKGKMLVGTLVLVAALVGLVLVVPTFAQGATPTPEAPHSWNGGGHGFGFRSGGPGFGLWGGGSSAVFDAAAKALGLSPEQLFEELHAGKSLADIAKAQNVELQKVYDAMNAARVEAMKANIEEAVKEGRITQAQADWILQGLEQGFLPRGHGFGRGGCGSVGRGPQFHRNGFAPTWAPSVAPSSSSR